MWGSRPHLGVTTPFEGKRWADGIVFYCFGGCRRRRERVRAGEPVRAPVRRQAGGLRVPVPGRFPAARQGRAPVRRRRRVRRGDAVLAAVPQHARLLRLLLRRRIRRHARRTQLQDQLQSVSPSRFSLFFYTDILSSLALFSLSFFFRLSVFSS